MFTVSVFSCFLVFYVTVSIILTYRLKQHFPKFYKKEKKSLFISMGIIIFSIIARILLNVLLAQIKDAMDDSYNQSTWLFPFVYFISSIFASLLPLSAIIVSLMYAVKQKEKIFVWKRNKSKMEVQ